MTYDLFILPRARKELFALVHPVRQRVVTTIQKMAIDPRPRGSRKLSGREGWRIRAGDYRVIYEIDDQSHRVTVLHIGHRRDVYR